MGGHGEAATPSDRITAKRNEIDIKDAKPRRSAEVDQAAEGTEEVDADGGCAKTAEANAAVWGFVFHQWRYTTGSGQQSRQGSNLVDVTTWSPPMGL